jgi:uncharacterized lipoprotein NlpE involved in copper resistance
MAKRFNQGNLNKEEATEKALGILNNAGIETEVTKNSETGRVVFKMMKIPTFQDKFGLSFWSAVDFLRKVGWAQISVVK